MGKKTKRWFFPPSCSKTMVLEHCSLGEIGIHDRLKICSRFIWGMGSSPIASKGEKATGKCPSPSISKKHPCSISKKHPFFEIEHGCFFEIEAHLFFDHIFGTAPERRHS